MDTSDYIPYLLSDGGRSAGQLDQPNFNVIMSSLFTVSSVTSKIKQPFHYVICKFANEKIQPFYIFESRFLYGDLD